MGIKDKTTIKNIALEGILINANSESIQVMYDKVVNGYHNAPALQERIVAIIPKAHIFIITLDIQMLQYGLYLR